LIGISVLSNHLFLSKGKTFRLCSRPCSNFSGNKTGLVITRLRQRITPHDVVDNDKQKAKQR
jgi:hypothetical protein